MKMFGLGMRLGERAAHADALGSLAGEEEGDLAQRTWVLAGRKAVNLPGGAIFEVGNLPGRGANGARCGRFTPLTRRIPPRCGPCNGHNLGRRRARGRRYCTWGNSAVLSLLARRANGVCRCESWNDFFWVRPWRCSAVERCQTGLPSVPKLIEGCWIKRQTNWRF